MAAAQSSGSRSRPWPRRTVFRSLAGSSSADAGPSGGHSASGAGTSRAPRPRSPLPELRPEPASRLGWSLPAPLRFGRCAPPRHISPTTAGMASHTALPHVCPEPEVSQFAGRSLCSVPRSFDPMVAEANSVCSGRGLACRLPDDCCTLLTVERLSLGPPSITADPMLMEAEALGTSYHTHARVSSSTAGSTDIRLDTAPIQETMLHNQVALESVRFEIDSIDQVARSPDSRRNVTVSRGSQEAPPLLLSPDVSSPI